MAKRKKNAAKAPDPRKKGKKRKAAQPPEEPAATPKGRPAQQAGSVPPLDAFDQLPKRRPPAHMRQQIDFNEALQAQQAAEQADEKKGKRRAKAASPKAGAGKPAGEAGGETKRGAAKAQKPDKKPKRRPKKVNPARRRLRRRIAAVLAIVLFVVVGTWVTVTTLFKIDSFDVQGDSPYTLQELAAAFGHTQGDNMYGFSAQAAEERMTTTLPYLETVSVRRRLPSTIVFQVTQAEEVYYLSADEGFAVLSASRKVLRVAAEEPMGLVRIGGLSHLRLLPGLPLALSDEAAAAASQEAANASSAASGGSTASASGSSTASKSVAQSQSETSQSRSESTSVSSDAAGGAGEGDASGEDSSASGASQSTSDGTNSTDTGAGQAAAPPAAQPEDSALQAAESLENLDFLLNALADSGLEGVSWVDVGDALNLQFGWQDRITVKLGPKSGLGEKLSAAIAVMTDPTQGLGPSDRGTLDMTYYLTTNQTIFQPE